ncbi:hypothetical protein BU23DRAFT_554103 [Bimuria novae-zelandiae CBS 107.79]|uniref:Uncharacterized protein n=1 Tax=Bimuria novae-zelandiae CBS 107.79 TaxID=1447943 RepID=A0A6A5V9W4_9PLEO|nr:hypothetical protein BU23DRAFT_554103 [Bimuria novae-zelandiae CBS 107.79]
MPRWLQFPPALMGRRRGYCAVSKAILVFSLMLRKRLYSTLDSAVKGRSPSS